VNTTRPGRYPAAPWAWAAAAVLVLCGGRAATAGPAPGTASSAAGPAGDRLPFGPGEDLRFAVKFGPVRAGSARMKVEGTSLRDGVPTVRIVSTAESSRFFSTFFEVRDRVESTWSLTDGLPRRFERNVHEGSYRKQESVIFDRSANVARYADGRTVEIPPRAYDVLSAFYYVRGLDLSPGTVVRFPNHNGGKNYDLAVRVLRREKIEVDAGKFSCLVIEPDLTGAGLFKQEGKLTIWITDDARRMPVLMKSKVAVGSIVAELEKYRVGTPLRRPAGEAP